MKTRKFGLLHLLVILCVGALIASACGSSSDEPAADAVDDEAEQAQAEEVEAAESAGEDIRGDAGEAVHGGTLTYGIEADVANPWAPYGLVCSVSCAMPLGALADPLLDFDPDGNMVPVLAESIESNDDATVWTVTLREGVLFHDGTPFDAEAVKYNFDLCRASPARGPDFALVDDIATEGTNTVIFTLSTTWLAFPAAGLDTPCGTHLMAPSWLKTLESNPLRGESIHTGTELIDQDTVDTPADGDQSAPVSMGPFQFVSYTPGNGNGMIVERFEDYWRGDGPNSVTGEGLPYLDGIEFVIAVDITSRSSGVRAGDFDIIHTSNSDEIASFRDDGSFVSLEANQYGETNFALVNQADGDLDPDGVNAANPLLDVRVRRALAHAIDRDRFVEDRGAGITRPANGPFSPGRPGFLDDNGYPDFDPEAAVTLLDEYLNDPERNDGKAAGEPISFPFNTTNDAFNVESNELVVSMWTDAFGDKVEVLIQPIEQGAYVGQVAVGQYQVVAWRQHPGTDPDTDFRFWSGSTALPIGTPGNNFGRFHDPELDALMDAARATTDEDERLAVLEDINRRFGEQVYYLAFDWTLWGVIAQPYVQDIAPLPLPDGGETFPIIAGAHATAQIWCTDGACE